MKSDILYTSICLDVSILIGKKNVAQILWIIETSVLHSLDCKYP